MTEYMYLTTTGWKTAQPHEIEIWYVPFAERFYLVAGAGQKAHWVQNIMHNPVITFRIADVHFRGSGRIVDRAAEPELAAQVSALMNAKYDWSDGLIVELTGDTLLSGTSL